ncbi:uncharacterized protein LOC129235438 [Anastrepha obliqua]|uniref:uncharacterized protein LOC129235438 n=1 Tax=Anastrepha obliqua TaxID=95512 RepID=UPI00240966BF|nr:uncharacterized protein LOC129235438 [Anastrepha obliqua]
MSKVVSTKQQLEKLVALMEENPQFAKGICSKVHAAKKWEEFTTELNCLGPPIRTAVKWIKVWADMKSKAKKKCRKTKLSSEQQVGALTNFRDFQILKKAYSVCCNLMSA